MSHRKIRSGIIKRSGSTESGFTLVELVVVIVIMAIIVATAVQKISVTMQTGEFETARHEMDVLAEAIAGNQRHEHTGAGISFGYTGDIGALPPNMDALITNPGGYATWNGPYIKSDFQQIPDDYKTDPWQAEYTIVGASILSTGSGSNIYHNLAGSVEELLCNTVSGNIFDSSGLSPGNIYRDSLLIRLTVPNGLGQIIAKTANPDIGGYFTFDSIPIGQHTLSFINIPNNDTVNRFVTVTPGSHIYGEYYLAVAFGESGGIEYVAGSIAATTGQDNRIEFDITNNSGSDITVSGMTLTWPTPTAYYEKIKFGTPWVFSENNPRTGSGQAVVFTSPQTLGAGETITIRIDKFVDIPSGNGNNVDMCFVELTVILSDGSSFVINTGACQ